MTRRIVITGGPGTGKTALVRELEQRGYPCYHEIIRDMTAEARREGPPSEQLVNPLTFVKDPRAFNMEILRGRMAQFNSAADLQDPFVFFDRGLPDVLAYMRYFGQRVEAEFSVPPRELQYDMVFLLPPWKEIYRRDGERLESFQQACEIHQWLEHTYVEYGYELQGLNPGPVPDRVDQLITLIEMNYG